jgi:hypothetical protein
MEQEVNVTDTQRPTPRTDVLQDSLVKRYCYSPDSDAMTTAALDLARIIERELSAMAEANRWTY